jgi:hypothetical protein
MAPETHAPIEIAEDVPRLRPDAGRGIFARLFGRRGPRYRPVVNDHYADRVARLVADGVDRGHLYYGQPCTCCPPGTGHVPRLAPQTYEGYAGGIVAPKARYPRPRWAHSSYNPSLRRGAPTPSEIAYARAAAAEAAAHAPVPEPLVDAYYEQTGRRRERQQAYAEPEFVDYGQGQYDPTHLAPPGSVPPPPALSPGLGIPTPSATPGVPPLVPAPVPVPGPGGPNYRVPVTPEDYAREAARNALQAKERERQQRILDEIGARERAQQQQYQQQQPGPYQQSQYQPQYPQQHPPGYQQQPYQQGYPQQHQQDQWARTMAAERARTGPRQPEGPSRRGSRGAGARQAPMGVFSGAETPRRTAYDRRAAFDPKYRRG